MHGHSEDRGLVYQQASGMQFNASQLFVSKDLIDPAPQTSIVSDWDRISDLDALELGVHRAAVEQGSAVPPYVARDHDAEIDRQISAALSAGGGFILLVGNSTAGKTRSAYEALQRTAADRRIAQPQDAMELESALVAAMLSPEACVIWLDELERFISADERASKLVSQARKRAVIIATIRADSYDVLGTPVPEASTDGHVHAVTNMEYLFKQIEPIVIPRMWSKSELERARGEIDSRVALAVSHADLYGVAEYLAAGPRLTREWRLAHESGENPRGVAIVSAAVDIALTGFSDPISLALLRSAHKYHLERAGGPMLRPESIETALSWASRRRYGITSLLLPAGVERYRPFDYLVDISLRDNAIEIPDQIWRLVLEHVSDNQPAQVKIGRTAYRLGRKDVAREVLETAATSSDLNGYAAAALSWYHAAEEELEAATKWLRIASDRGNADATLQLGLIEEQQGNDLAAEKLFRAGADAGNGHGAYHLATLVRRLGRVEEAEKWYERAVALDQPAAFSELTNLLSEHGRAQEAETWLRKLADSSPAAANTLAILLVNDGRETEALEWWTKAAQDGDLYSRLNIGEWHLRQDNYAEAQTWATTDTDPADPRVSSLLGRILWASDRSLEAEAYLIPAADGGDAAAAVALAGIAYDRGEPAKAIDYLRIAITDQDIDRARVSYLLGAHLLDLDSGSDEGMRYLTEAADSGLPSAASLLADLMEKKGNHDESRRLNKVAADGGDAQAACHLGFILSEAHEFDEAEKYFTLSFESGHTHAGCSLGQLRWRRGDKLGGEHALVQSFDGGHDHAAQILSRLLAADHRGKDAAEWHRRFHGGARPPTRPAGAKRGKARRKQR